MPRRTTKFFPGMFFHVYNRANDGRPLFWEPENYRFFLSRLAAYFPTDNVELHGFCLMPTHYHLLLRLLRPWDLSRAMQRISVSYAKAINRWRGKEGHVFQGRFRAKAIENTAYLQQVSLYIHLNPSEAGLVADPEEWDYSSLKYYLHMTNEGVLSFREGSQLFLNRSLVSESIGGPEEYLAMLRRMSSRDFEEIGRKEETRSL